MTESKTTGSWEIVGRNEREGVWEGDREGRGRRETHRLGASAMGNILPFEWKTNWVNVSGRSWFLGRHKTNGTHTLVPDL